MIGIILPVHIYNTGVCYTQKKLNVFLCTEYINQKLIVN